MKKRGKKRPSMDNAKERSLKINHTVFIFTVSAVALYYVWRMFAVKPWYDELYTYYYFISRGPVYSAIHWPLPNNHFLYSVLSSVLDWIGSPLLGLRGISLFCGVANLILVGTLAEKLFGAMYKTAAVCIYAGMELVNYYAVQGRGYTLGIFLYLTAIYCLYRICISERDDRKYYLIFSAALTLGLYTVISDLYWVIPLCLGGGFILLSLKKRERLWRLIKYSVLAAVNTLIIYSLVWIALGSNLLQDAADSPYYGLSHAAIIKADLLQCWLSGERFMRSSPGVQGVDFKGLLYSFLPHWRTLFNLMYAKTDLLVLLGCSAVLILAFLRLRRGDRTSAEEKFILLYLTVTMIATPAIMLIQSALPFHRVYTFVGVPLTFGFFYLVNRILSCKPGLKNRFLPVLTVLTAVLLVSRLSLPYYNRQYSERETQCFEMMDSEDLKPGDSIFFLDEYQSLIAFFQEKDYREAADIREADFLIMPLGSTQERKTLEWPDFYGYDQLDWEYISGEFEAAGENDYYRLYCRKKETEDHTVQNHTAAGAVDTGEGIWMYAVSAGKADAVLIGAGDTVCLVDTGYARSRGKILAAMKQVGAERLDAVFVTHTDKDHTEGLKWLSESDIEVGAWYASAMYLDVKEKKHPAVKAAAKRGQETEFLKAGDTVSFDGMEWEVLAPSVMAEDKDNNNSLVMMVKGQDGSVLLTGDMEFEEEGTLLKSGVELKCDVLKVANHADNDTMSEAFLLAASPQAAVISTSSKEKPETPDLRILGLLQSADAETAVTEECSGGILVRLEKGKVSMERVDFPLPESNVSVEKVIAEEDLVVLYNGGDEAEDLTGCYLVSDRGGEWFVFPEKTVLKAGEELVIATESSKGDFDLCWEDEKVIHKSKTDVITLYDGNGMEISRLDNGF